MELAVQQWDGHNSLLIQPTAINQAQPLPVKPLETMNSTLPPSRADFLWGLSSLYLGEVYHGPAFNLMSQCHRVPRMPLEVSLPTSERLMSSHCKELAWTENEYRTILRSRIGSQAKFKARFKFEFSSWERETLSLSLPKPWFPCLQDMDKNKGS